MIVDAIKRYEHPEIARIWSDRVKYKRWAEVEIVAASVQGAPGDVLADMRQAFVPTGAEVDDRELKTRHDVVAFLELWRENMRPASRPWVHRNMTSSDLVDTANALRMVETLDYIVDNLDGGLSMFLARHALAHWETVRVGRTHGQTAEVTTWGHRMAELAFNMDRASRRLRGFRADIAVGKLSGPVGDFKRITARQEQDAMRSLNLGVTQASSQVIMRDVYADFVYGLAQVATAIEALALEVRLSSRSDTGEVAEGFDRSHQRGSSAMPHKRNPIRSEKLCGLARLVRAQVEPIMQGVALHHERDISHSSVERVALETAATLTAHMMAESMKLIEDLDVRKDVMRRRVQTSPELMTATVKDHLIENGVDPSTAWNLVSNAYGTLADGLALDFNDALQASWASVTRHGALPGTRPGWKPDFATLLHPLSDPITLVGNTAHIKQELEVIAGF